MFIFRSILVFLVQFCHLTFTLRNKHFTEKQTLPTWSEFIQGPARSFLSLAVLPVSYQEFSCKLNNLAAGRAFLSTLERKAICYTHSFTQDRSGKTPFRFLVCLFLFCFFKWLLCPAATASHHHLRCCCSLHLAPAAAACHKEVI